MIYNVTSPQFLRYLRSKMKGKSQTTGTGHENLWIPKNESNNIFNE